MMSPGNPCLTCGACCAFFRVSFYWGETDLAPGGSVPQEFTEPLSDFLVCMKGTNQKKPRCAALEGEIGKAVRCAIYDNRPTPCREFGVFWEKGTARIRTEELQRCNRARAAWGLPPLSAHVFRLFKPRVPVRHQVWVYASHTARLSRRLIRPVRDPRDVPPRPPLPVMEPAARQPVRRAIF